MVQEAMTYVDKTPNQETKLELIQTLRTVTEGKIFVEVERARVTLILAKIKEGEGKIVEACDILQELQVRRAGGGLAFPAVLHLPTYCWLVDGHV